MDALTFAMSLRHLPSAVPPGAALGCMTSVALKCVPPRGPKLQRFHQPERLYVIALWQRGQHKLQLCQATIELH
ncbi:hypothetical protein R8871_05710 [Paraburkholderia graminis C4D1M]|jgi:hypothetical protein|uniref:Uncharacterized protein n=1 Tax=Paraburkholderia graminis (strain ATCC 700544 / DSM 17151 / LMG 18924 / NCIMB 13744 / C4D1M) TaxID=396598 RepID=B1FU16_PARG4|nr:hypothetical protein BgramDRAFT_0350 [Paraburkholderia graminis C4D1M]CAB3730752.1 hypothetical protein R8871_05710 [Paraburkholderia graminis C4D1M]